MTHTTITTTAVERTIIKCDTYKEAKSASLDFLFNHSGLMTEILGGNLFIILDKEYRTIAEIHWNGFKNE